jgi:hypothetical protein
MSLALKLELASSSLTILLICVRKIAAFYVFNVVGYGIGHLAVKIFVSAEETR